MAAVGVVAPIRIGNKLRNMLDQDVRGMLNTKVAWVDLLRLGETGEAIAFDSQGLFLTPRRHEQAMKAN